MKRISDELIENIVASVKEVFTTKSIVFDCDREIANAQLAFDQESVKAKREELAERLHEKIALELAVFITEYNANVRSPEKWKKKTDRKFWYAKADQIIALILE